MKDIIREISRNGTKLADHIQMQSQIIRKFSQPHFREGMVSLSPTINSLSLFNTVCP